MRRITLLVVVCAVITAVVAPSADAARAKARHLTGGLPFKPAQGVQGGQLPYTGAGIGLGGTALLGVLMLSGGLLVRRAAAQRA
jgi:LPXTG-motif cell wall-anchored protein